MADVTEDIKADVRNSGYNAIAKGRRKNIMHAVIPVESSVYTLPRRKTNPTIVLKR